MADGKGVLLVVGLGNPGIEYQFTPHNAGFLAIDRIAESHGATVANRRGKALTAKVTIAGRDTILAKPETFMNLSGLSVAALAAECGADPTEDLIVLYDELALPLGAMRIREGGSAAGHNGAKSINSSLRTEDWARVRIGVGPDASPETAYRRGKDYLLSPLRKADLAELAAVLDKAEQAVEKFAASGIRAAMNEFNRRDNPPAG